MLLIRQVLESRASRFVLATLLLFHTCCVSPVVSKETPALSSYTGQSCDPEARPPGATGYAPVSCHTRYGWFPCLGSASIQGALSFGPAVQRKRTPRKWFSGGSSRSRVNQARTFAYLWKSNNVSNDPDPRDHLVGSTQLLPRFVPPLIYSLWGATVHMQSQAWHWVLHV